MVEVAVYVPHEGTVSLRAALSLKLWMHRDKFPRLNAGRAGVERLFDEIPCLGCGGIYHKGYGKE